MVKEEQIEKRQPEWFESKIEIKFTSLLVSFAMCAKRLQYLRHSHYSSRERKRHTLTSASSLRFHNRIIPFHHVHGKSATHNRHRSVNMFSQFFFSFFSALITSCSSTGSSAPHSVTFYAILYRICARAKSRYILPPSTPTNDNSLIHPLSISHFYDEPNRIPSHRLSFNVLPFMVIQLIHILVGSLCFSRRPRSMVRPHR